MTMEQVKGQLLPILCSVRNRDENLGMSSVRKRVIKEILSIPIDGKPLRELINCWINGKLVELDPDQSLPKPILNPNTLDAVDVKGVFPHVATAISRALVVQSKSIQEDMLKERWVKAIKEEK